MPTRERISGVDTAWLRMEQPTNLMMIVSVMMLERPPSLAEVRRAVKSRFLAYRRFACRAVQDATGAWWEEDADFDIEHHVQQASLSGRAGKARKAGKAELEDLVSELASTPLDFARPLWQFHLVELDGAAAIVSRIHHCYADGIALVEVMLSLTSETARESLRHAKPAAGAAARGSARGEPDFWEQFLKPVAGALGAIGGARGLIEQGIGVATNPEAAASAVQGAASAMQGAASAAQEAARKGVDFAAEVARIVTMGRDSDTRFKGPLGTRKRAAWAEPLPLAEVKAVGKAFNCSINDVLLSMASGALRDYLIAKGDSADGVEIRSVVPVNLRPPGQGRNLGNHFGLVFLELPIGIAHPLERLYEMRRRMTALKGSYQPIIALGLLSAVGHGPKALQDQVTSILGASASAVMTNVPGPKAPLYFAGKRITAFEFWVPQSGSIGMGVSILSYDGRIHFGVITDEGLVPDPHAIVDRFAEEFEQLLWITLMSPWGEEAADSVVAQEAQDPPARAAPERPARSAAPRAARPAAEGRIPKRFRNL
jgi:WS/DGAT/MGAT family acyltransferase